MMIREPKTDELVAFICSVQPELDSDAARALLANRDVATWIAERWTHHRVLADSLLEHHLSLEESIA